VAFSWRAKFPVAGPIAWLSIVDAYEERGGRMDGRIWGIVPFMRTRGDEVEVGELSRYMSETPWTPHSIIGNRDLEWREADERVVTVATSVGPRPVKLTFEFDDEGDISSCFMADRPRQVRAASRRRGGASSQTTHGSRAACGCHATGRSGGSYRMVRSCTGRAR
jgi:hypothetical protein